MIVFRGTDILQHTALRFWHEPDHRFHHIVPDFYGYLDAILGELLSQLGPDVTSVIMSDHGFRLTNKVIYINRWLAENGYLAIRQFSILRSTRRGRSEWRIGRLLNRAGLSFLARRLPLRIRSHHISLPVSLEKQARIDWSRTRAYAPLASFLEVISVNLEGREPQGIVRPGDYDVVRNSLIRDLASVRDPTTGAGTDLLAVKREDVYHGPWLELAPDLILEFDDESYTVDGSLAARSPMKELKWPRAEHASDGILLMGGRDIRPHMQISGARIIDLLPTILYLMDIPIPDDLDGTALLGPIAEEYTSTHPIQFEAAESERVAAETGTTFSEEEEERIREGLRGLGYL